MILDSLKNKFQLRFKSREIAASILAGALEDSLKNKKKINVDRKKDRLLVLGIPRGGVLVTDIVASKLPYQCEFDIIVPRKLTAPGNQEIVIGAIMMDKEGDGNTTAYLNDERIRN
jgi:putative phosphoribosyl transferase